MWATITNTAILAATDTTAFWNSTIGKFLGAILTGVGILVVLFALVKAVGGISKGKVGEGVKSVVIGAIVAAFCFQPKLIGDLIDLFSNIVGKVIESITSIGG
jgi:hypothetical protein